MSNNNEDVIASVIESQNDGQLDTEVGQDEGMNNEESSTTDWEAQAKYHQSEKDKLYAENQDLKQYEKIGRFLESRPDVAQKVLNEVGGQPATQEPRVTLKPDEFDPWEAYNDPSSASYKFRMQEMQETINGAVDQAVGGLQAQQGRTNLRSDLASRGLNDEQMDSFFEFADKHPSEYGLDNVLKMWQAVSQSPNTQAENPLDKIRQTQANPQSAGVLQGQQPERKSVDEQMYEDVINAGGFGNKLP
jgi:SOS response regulatory protein OraA/RecX